MDYNILLDLATDLGYELAMCGAETFRVEESVSRVLSSYGIASEVFAIPNYLIVTVMMEATPSTIAASTTWPLPEPRASMMPASSPNARYNEPPA